MSQLIEELLGSMPPPPNPLGLQSGDTICMGSGCPQMAVIDITFRGLIIREWFGSERL